MTLNFTTNEITQKLDHLTSELDFNISLIKECDPSLMAHRMKRFTNQLDTHLLKLNLLKQCLNILDTPPQTHLEKEILITPINQALSTIQAIQKDTSNTITLTTNQLDNHRLITDPSTLQTILTLSLYLAITHSSDQHPIHLTLENTPDAYTLSIHKNQPFTTLENTIEWKAIQTLATTDPFSLNAPKNSTTLIELNLSKSISKHPSGQLQNSD